jgi:ComF family protein
MKFSFNQIGLVKVINWFSQLNQKLLPQSCFLCSDISIKPLCAPCLADLPNQVTRCSCCAKPQSEIVLCDECQSQPPPYTHIQTLFSYTYPIDQLIIAAKFHQNLVILKFLGELMGQRLIIQSCPQVLIPVPLHLSRLRQRGYNQSLELAKVIAKHTGIPIASQACERIKNTLPQTSLSGKQRQTNVKDAFKLIKINPDWQHIALIDDVVTTSSTVAELARIFREVGVERVDIWCCARRYVDSEGNGDRISSRRAG